MIFRQDMGLMSKDKRVNDQGSVVHHVIKQKQERRVTIPAGHVERVNEDSYKKTGSTR